jgi:glutamyl-tRNA reductase
MTLTRRILRPSVSHTIFMFMPSALFTYVGNFWAIGISYHKADLQLRERFSLSEDQISALLQSYQAQGGKGLMVLSTCNRTELYGFASHAEELIELFCAHVEGTVAEWQAIGSVKQNVEAVRHLLRVGAGLDSKILGDFQIIGQVKRAFDRSKALGVTNAFLERLVNVGVEVSKRVKNETELSSGAASVSFAAVQYVKQHLPTLKNIQVLLLGTGDIGRSTCDNLIKHLPDGHVTLMNRTPEKAQALAEKYNLPIRPISELTDGIRKAHVVIVATGASSPTVRAEQLPSEGGKTLFIDLSVPRNVDQSIETDPGSQVMHIDQLIDLTQSALAKRAEEVPAAEALVQSGEAAFYQWLESRKFAPVLQALRAELVEIQRREINTMAKKNPEADMVYLETLGERMVQKITNRFAKHLHSNRDQAELSLLTIQEIFDLPKTA